MFRQLFIALLLVLVAIGVVQANSTCPPWSAMKQRKGCLAAAAGGCPVEFVGRGCRMNCMTFPHGCPKGSRTRYADGGCKPIGFCGFKCRDKCVSFKRCMWVPGTGCANRG